MKKLFIILMFALFSYSGFSQEYDDMYFNKKDRVVVKTVSTTKYINPEYLERYVSEPETTTIVYTTYQQRPRYNNWRWNISFGYNYGYNPYYDPFYMDYNYYSYPYYYNRYSYYGWHNPYRFYSWYGYPHYYHHNHYNNYAYKQHYGGKQYATKYKNEVNYNKRRTRGTIHVPDKTRTTNKVANSRTNQNVRVPQKYSRTKTYSTPSRTTKTYNTPRKTYSTQSRTTKTYSTPSRATKSYSTPSRNSYSAPSRAPSRSSGSSSGGRTSSSSSRGRRQ